MTTVGAATHTHTSSNFYCGYGDYVSACSNDYTRMAAHQHGSPSWSIGSADNLPPGYGLDIIYVSLDTWENSVRCFPAGAVVVSANVLATGSKFARFSSADGKFIYNAAPGTSVGSTSTHSHSLSGTSGSAGSSGNPTTYRWSPRSYAAEVGSHTHTMSATSTSIYKEPAYIQTRLYEALQETDDALKDVVVFLDGAPSANWEVLTSWNGKSLKAGNVDPTFGGSDTHGHTYSGTSSSRSVYGDYSSSDSGSVTAATHDHSFSGDLADASNIPSSIQLTPYKLLHTILKNTRTVVYSQDLLIKRTQPSQAAFDLMSKKNDIGKTSTYNLRLRDSCDLYTLSDMLSKVELSKTFESDLMFVSRGISVYQSGIKLNLLGTHYQNTIRLITRDHGDTWVLGAWLYAIVRQMDKIQQRAELAYLIHDVNYATEEDLDEFGSKYDLARRSGESDWDYRKRIKMFTSQLTGSGTRDVLESIINSITEVDGSANVVTYPPAHVGITFSSTDAIIAALEHKDLIELSLENALAAGVGYTLYLPIIRYLMSYSSIGPADFDYPCSILNKMDDVAFDFYMGYGAVSVSEENCDFDVLVRNFLDLEYAGSMCMSRLDSRYINADITTKKENILDGDNYIFMKKMGVLCTVLNDISMLKYGIMVHHGMRAFLKRSRTVRYFSRMNIRQHGHSYVDLDILSRSRHDLPIKMMYSQSKIKYVVCESNIRMVAA